MAICKTCNKKFHACTNCGLEKDWMYEYCDDECWGKSKEYISNKHDFMAWWLSLNEFQKGLFKVMWKEFLWNSDYESEINKWIKV